MGEYTAVNGTKFTDTDIEGWAAEAESEQGYTGAHLGPSAPGRSVSVGAEARPLTIRLDAARRAKLTARAEEQQHQRVPARPRLDRRALTGASR